MSLSTLGLFLVVVFITCVTPGAGVLYTLHNAVNYGVKNAFMSPTGNAIGVAVMSVIAASGMGAVINNSPVLFYGLQTAGCLLMAWFGWKSWKAPAIALKDRLGTPLDPAEQKARNWNILASAAVLQLSNPMLIVFLLSLMPQFIDPKQAYLPQITILIALFVGICWLVHIGYSYSAAMASDRWMGPKFSFYLNKISAFLFWGIGGSVMLHLYGLV